MRQGVALLLVLSACGVDAARSPRDEPQEGPCGSTACECPPPGPFGYDVGDQAADLPLTTCSGEPLSLHSLCGARAGVVVAFFAWCTTCWPRVELVRDLQAQHAADGMQSLIVVVEDSFGDPATAETCDQAATYFGTDAVALDASASIESYGTTDLVIVMDGNGVITFRRQDASDGAVTEAIEALLE